MGVDVIILFRCNVRFWKLDIFGVRECNEVLRVIKYLGRVFWKRWSGYYC